MFRNFHNSLNSLKPVHIVAEKCDNLSHKSETVTEKCNSHRISPLSRRFRRQSHFSATFSLLFYSLTFLRQCGQGFRVSVFSSQQPLTLTF